MSKEWRKIESKRRYFERKYEIRFSKVLREQLSKVIEYLKSERQYYDIEDIIDSLIEPDVVQNEMIDLYKTVGYDFIKLTPSLVKADNLAERSFWESELERLVMTEAGSRIVSITATNRDNIIRLVRKYLDEGIQNGLGIEDITRNLLNNLTREVNSFTRIQARRIAQTEVIGASNRATWEAAKRLEVPVMKHWLIAPLGIAKTERHTIPGAVDQYIKQMNEPFYVDGGSGPAPMMHPGDPQGGAENVINCRCAMSFKTI